MAAGVAKGYESLSLLVNFVFKLEPVMFKS